MSRTFFKRGVTIVIALLLLIYVGSQIYSTSFGGVKTETVSYMTSSDTIDTRGFVIREETVIKPAEGVNGVYTYLLSDGEKVGKDGVVAELYQNGADAAAQSSIEELEQEIKSLKQLSRVKESYATSPDTLDKQISQNFVKLLSSVSEKSYLNLGDTRDQLLYLLNERQLITGAVTDFNDRISSLQSQLDDLKASHKDSTGKVTSPVSGYFVSSLDGYENAFSYKDVLNISLSDLDKEPAKTQVKDGQALGKVISGLNWYVACKVPADAALALYNGKNVTIDLPFASNQSVPATVAAINQPDKKTDAAVILKCNYMSSELAGIRSEEIRINVDTYSGLRVSKKAIHMNTVSRTVTGEDGKKKTEEKEVQGVYVLYGSELRFKEINPIHGYSNYVICDPDQSSESLFSGETVKLYDEVVMEGTDLYDGKIVK